MVSGNVRVNYRMVDPTDEPWSLGMVAGIDLCQQIQIILNLKHLGGYAPGGRNK
jgi:hypothetical protein